MLTKYSNTVLAAGQSTDKNGNYLQRACAHRGTDEIARRSVREHRAHYQRGGGQQGIDTVVNMSMFKTGPLRGPHSPSGSWAASLRRRRIRSSSSRRSSKSGNRAARRQPRPPAAPPAASPHSAGDGDSGTGIGGRDGHDTRESARLAKVGKGFEDPDYDENVAERYYGVVCDAFDLSGDIAETFDLEEGTPCACTSFLGNKPDRHHDDAPELYEWFQWSEFIKWAVFDADYLPASDFEASPSEPDEAMTE